MKKAVAMLVVLLFGLALVLGYARANPGALDPTWGKEGVVLTDFDGMDDFANAHVLQANGKYVVAGWVNIWPGDIGVARYLPDGRLDPQFGDGGLVVTAFSDDPDNVEAGWAAGDRPNGGVFVAADVCDADYNICELGVAAYLEDGTLDGSFGDDGLVTVNPGVATYAWPGRVILQPDGKLVIGGVVILDDDSVDLIFARFDEDGELDDAFGNGGISIIDLDGAENLLQDIVALPGDEILAVGSFGVLVDPINVEQGLGFLAQINSDGSLDDTFAGGDGYLTWDHGAEWAIGQHVVITPDDQILVLGYMAAEDGSDCTLQRYDLSGNLDTTFGDNGLVVIDSGQEDSCLEIEFTPDDKIVFGGPAWPPAPEEDPELASSTGMNTRMQRRLMSRGMLRMGVSYPATRQNELFENLIARYNADGTPDDTFGDNGLLRLSIEEGAGIIYNVTVQRDGKILAASDVLVDEDINDFGVIRLLGDGPAAQVYAPVVQR
jgi:uncharacterized delta-60 repeat protein